MTNSDCSLDPHAPELEALRQLMLRAGVVPSRVENMVGEIINGRAETANCTCCERELEALRETVGDGLDALKIDQHTTLKALSLSISIFRNDAKVYQFAFISAARRMNGLLIATIFLQIIMLGVVCVSLFTNGWWTNSQAAGSLFPQESRDKHGSGGVYVG